MSGFRLMTPEELAAASMFEEHNPAPGKYRWHCTRCGRFVPSATVRRLPPIPGEADDRDYQGTCKTHGRVEVTWGEQ